MEQAPKLFSCPACGGPVAYTAAACPRCGHRPTGARAGNTANIAAIALGIGGLLVAAGSFLPWITVSSLVSLSRTGLDGGGDGILTLGIGVVLLLIAVANFARAGLGWGSRMLGFLGGLAAVALATVDGKDEANRLAAVSSAYVSGSVGMGIYVVLIGGGVAILVAILGGKHASATA